MKVLYLHQYFSTPNGASGTRSYEFARELVEAGHQVQMICLNEARGDSGLGSINFNFGLRRGIVDGIEVIEFNIPYSNHSGLVRRSLIFIEYSIKSLAFAYQSNCDLIFATSTPLTASIPGIILRLLRGTPFVFEIRDLWPELPKSMGIVKNPFILTSLSWLEWFSYHIADNCIGLAPGICEGIASQEINHEKIHLIPNASDLEIFRPLSSEKNKTFDQLRDFKIFLKTTDFVAAFTGAHGLANGLESVLDVACSLKKKQRNDIKLLFIGDGKYKKNLIEIAEKKKLDNCYFVPPIPKKKLANIFESSVNVGLMVLKNIPAFYNSTSPNKFFDYLASGLPIVNNYPGWIADLINENNLGIVVPPDNPELFADALIFIKDNPQKSYKMGSNSRELAETTFSRRLIKKDFKELIESTHSRYKNRKNSYLIKLFYSGFKTFSDRTLALFSLIILSPALLIISILVLIKCGKPIFFVQKRPGLGEKIFGLIKFRTMTIQRDTNGKLLDDEQRLTPFGNWLRSTSLDELPSLINILKGEMSFIGPRPLLIRYLPLYSKEQKRRHDVKPGFTGLAQINGRNQLSWEERFNFDVIYVENRSFVLDLKIFFITIWKVFIKEGINASNHVTMRPFQGSNQKN